jgi:hypothetical protein
MPESPNGGYHVHLSIHIAKKLRRIQERATRQGRGEACVTAFRRIVERLMRDPLNFGEPLYRLPAMRLRVRQAAIFPLFVDFAVSEDHPLVYIKGVTLL